MSDKLDKNPRHFNAGIMLDTPELLGRCVATLDVDPYPDVGDGMVVTISAK